MSDANPPRANSHEYDMFDPQKQQDSIFSVGLEQESRMYGVDDSLMYGSNQMEVDLSAAGNLDGFEDLTKKKYLFPSEKLTQKEWFKELQKPLNITVADIRRDFQKFVKDFPTDIIPH
jgi:hypothetical protein